MKNIVLVAAVLSLSVSACGSDDGERTGDVKQGFSPPPPKAGYTRIVAPAIKDIKPGDDVTYCQYVGAPLDHDIDILDVQGYQSDMGHHAVAYARPEQVTLGKSTPCTGEDNITGSFIGGIGGEAGGGVKLPEGVAFRVPAGSSIMLNTHFLNVGKTTIEGNSVLDVKFAEADPTRKVASLFANVSIGFTIPPNGSVSATAECTFPRDMDFLLFSNHMHDYGSHALSEVERKGTRAMELVHEDPSWTYEMQFKAVNSSWGLDAPLRIRQGDTLRTHCNWENTTAAMVQFPREMCVGVGFFISDGSSSPTCVNGAWIERKPGQL
jgi:hypothetical protein